MTTTKPSNRETALNTLGEQGQLTSAETAGAAELGHSTVGNMLAALERERPVRRIPGGREGRRRLPDRLSVRAGDEHSASGASPGGGASSERLRPGQLDGLVMDVLNAERTDTPVGATAVAKALGRLVEAVGNCLVRLAAAGRVRQFSEDPRRYSAAAPDPDAPTATPRREEP